MKIHWWLIINKKAEDKKKCQKTYNSKINDQITKLQLTKELTMTWPNRLDNNKKNKMEQERRNKKPNVIKNITTNIVIPKLWLKYVCKTMH